MVGNAGRAVSDEMRKRIDKRLEGISAKNISIILDICTSNKPPQRGGAVPFPALGRVEMACQFPEGLIFR